MRPLFSPSLRPRLPPSVGLLQAPCPQHLNVRGAQRRRPQTLEGRGLGRAALPKEVRCLVVGRAELGEAVGQVVPLAEQPR